MLALEPTTTAAEAVTRLLDRLLPALPAGAKVLVKPDWCARHDPRPAENSSPAFLEAVLAWLVARGARPALGHTALLTPPDVPYLSFTELLKVAGCNELLESFPHVRLIDLETEPMALRRSGDDTLLLPTTLAEFDLVIVLATLKTHMGTLFAGGAKSLMGLIPDSEHLRYHRDGLDPLLAALADVAWPTLTLIEGSVGMEGEGPHHGDPVPHGLALGGDDLLEVDCAAAALMGISPDEVPHLKLLAARRGRALPGLPPEWAPLVRRYRRPNAHIQHGRRVRVYPGDSCATCQVAASSVERFARENPHRVADVAAVVSMLMLKGLNVWMGHQPQDRPPPPGELSLAVGDCARSWAEAHGVPLVGGCPLRVHEVQPALVEVMRRLNAGELPPPQGGR